MEVYKEVYWVFNTQIFKDSITIKYLISQKKWHVYAVYLLIHFVFYAVGGKIFS